MLADATKLLEAMKRAAMDVWENGKPCNWYFGTVISTSPLQVQIDQKLLLSAEQLVLGRHVTDYKVAATLDGKKDIIIHNSLAVGDKVILLRRQGGQEFLVLDKMP